jgi:hypothetical protein
MTTIEDAREAAEAGLLPFGEPSKKDAARAVKIAGRLHKEMQRACGKRGG